MKDIKSSEKYRRTHKPIKPPIFTPFFLAFLALITFASCMKKSPPTASENNGVNGFQLVELENDSDFSYIAAHEEGEAFVISTTQSDTAVEKVVYLNEKDDVNIVIWFNEMNLPLKAYSKEHVILFENYTEETVDIAVIGPNGDTDIQKGIPLSEVADGYIDDIDNTNTVRQASFRSKKANIKASTLIKRAGLAVSVAACGIAIVKTAGVAAAAIGKPCLGAAVSLASNLAPEDDVALQGTAGGISGFMGASACIDGASCIGYLLTTSGALAGLAESHIENEQSKVASLTGFLRFGGVWDRNDTPFLWLIVNEDILDEPIYYESSDCYRFNKYQFVNVEGDIFSYSTDQGNILELKYERVSEELLEITRLSDGRVFSFSPSSKDANSFTPECVSKTNQNLLSIESILN